MRQVLVRSNSASRSSGPPSTEGGDDGSRTDDGNYSRDAVVEVQRAARVDTRRVLLGRGAVAGALVVTAVAVSVNAYIFLKKEQESSFEQAYDKFSARMGNAALAQQRDLRSSFSSLGDKITGFAQSTDLEWPFVTMPYFESYGQEALEQSGTSLCMLVNRVEHEDRSEYTDYANANYESWVRESHVLKATLDDLDPVGYHPYIVRPTGPDSSGPDIDRDVYFPIWSISPPPRTYSVINYNMMSFPVYDSLVSSMLALNESVLSPVRTNTEVAFAYTQEDLEALHDHEDHNNKVGEAAHGTTHGETEREHQHSVFLHPVHEIVRDKSSPIVAFVAVAFAWDAALQNLLPDDVNGLYAVFRNSCNQTLTYKVSGQHAWFQGEGDFHEIEYSGFERVVDLTMSANSNFATTPGHCLYTMHIYPGRTFEDAYTSPLPAIFAINVAITFLFVIVVFFIYDRLVGKRNSKLMTKAARSNAIVTSLFPGTIGDRLLQEKTGDGTGEKKGSQKRIDTSLLDADERGGIRLDSRPLADLFLATTIMCADIVGFTAWSSVREPTQVFTLLENVYSGFDIIARRRRVFKVETIGDCYVAVTGLPDPRKDHAVAMVRFAKECMFEMQRIVAKLEVALGPDTGDLTLRIGIHSGPVTAGVLRGERSRFQLFGDTMNKASLIESTSERDRIHVSHETGQLLIALGKGQWLQARESSVLSNGKTRVQSYFLDLNQGGYDGVTATHVDSSVVAVQELAALQLSREDVLSIVDKRKNRLVSWNVELLSELLQQIVACRRTSTLGRRSSIGSTGAISFEQRGCVLEEVKEIILLPEFDGGAGNWQSEYRDVSLSESVVSQLEEYVATIAAMYRDNPFHNFDHASHVVMSVSKLMSRIVAPGNIKSDIDVHAEINDSVDNNNTVRRSKHQRHGAATLHDHTYGITSDPLTQFACAFSALIHDVDHLGVSNAQLVKENTPLASHYKNRSVAEQNSFDIAWALLMDHRYVDLRASLCGTNEELARLRQLVINGVMATDIVDKELKELRNARWDKAFLRDQEQRLDIQKYEHEDRNRRATIVIEHLIQASDVSHTMQHWHIYRKWNEHLFCEMYRAYVCGRAEKNPAENWYEGELGFFDFYIIPLANKLKDCGVFGVSSDEYLNYARKNRAEWERRGQEIVAEMMENVVNLK